LTSDLAPLSKAQLNAWSTTKAQIVQNARDTFNAHLSIMKMKAELIQMYLNLITNQGIPGTTPSPS
jgi:hypothetical protein